MTDKFDKALDEVLRKYFTDGYRQGFKDGYEEASVGELDKELIGYLCENAVGHKYFRWKKPSSVYKPIPLYTKKVKND
jgi:hypothetical protein